VGAVPPALRIISSRERTGVLLEPGGQNQPEAEAVAAVAPVPADAVRTAAAAGVVRPATAPVDAARASNSASCQVVKPRRRIDSASFVRTYRSSEAQAQRTNSPARSTPSSVTGASPSLSNSVSRARTISAQSAWWARSNSTIPCLVSGGRLRNRSRAAPSSSRETNTASRLREAWRKKSYSTPGWLASSGSRRRSSRSRDRSMRSAGAARAVISRKARASVSGVRSSGVQPRSIGGAVADSLQYAPRSVPRGSPTSRNRRCTRQASRRAAAGMAVSHQNTRRCGTLLCRTRGTTVAARFPGRRGRGTERPACPAVFGKSKSEKSENQTSNTPNLTRRANRIVLRKGTGTTTDSGLAHGEAQPPVEPVRFFGTVACWLSRSMTLRLTANTGGS
jgi:hypothetical protein